ncbi:heterokaryon incompatibility protein [Rutstroemia sp. NJR-2017a BVV2]|nr:heterokaryon incompatibility protein [Rutstroemia sp. NJR-2017a BVV2]
MTTSHAKIYPKSLNSQSIRLLHLDSVPLEQPIRCTLTTYPLSSLPAYSCLSYTWSDPLYHGLDTPEELTQKTDGQPKHLIICNSHPLYITDNLLDALLEFSKNAFRREPLLWIDGICINQNDIEERQIQVSIMGDIYSSCTNVIIWLGKADFHSSYAIEVMTLIASIPPSRYAGVQISDVEDWGVYETLGIPKIESWKWLEYAAFLQRTWFRRIWVVQEAFLPPVITVVCGGDLVKWEDIVACAAFLKETGLGTTLMKILVESADEEEEEEEEEDGNRAGGTVYVNNTMNNQSVFQSMRETMKLGKEERSRQLGLEKLMYYARFFDATNSKDRLYGVYGIWRESGKVIPEDMMPKYGADVSVEEVYTRAAWEIIAETGDLNILSLVEDRSLVKANSIRAQGKLPSWVPDFGSALYPQPLNGNPRPKPGAERWDTSSNLPFSTPPLPPPAERNFLTISGQRLDSICDCSVTQDEIMGDKFRFTDILKLLDRSPDQKYPSEKVESYFEAFWRTLIRDTFRKLPATNEARTAFQYFAAVRVSELRLAYDYALEEKDSDLPYLESLYRETKDLIVALSQHRHNKGFVPTWDTLEHLIEVAAQEDLELPEKQSLDKGYRQFYEAFRVAYSGRRLFRTEKGYLGIAAQALEVGDEIWKVAGAKVPMVLRKGGNKSSNWRLVGEAYVHGLMEDVTMTEEPIQKIVLE